MKRCENESYNRILDYLKNIVDIKANEKSYLLYYATQLYKDNVENVKYEEIKDICEALKEIVSCLSMSSDTSFVTERLGVILDLVMLVSNGTISDEELCEISYQIDKLYCDLDLPARKNSSLSYNLYKLKIRSSQDYESKRSI